MVGVRVELRVTVVIARVRIWIWIHMQGLAGLGLEMATKRDAAYVTRLVNCFYGIRISNS